MNENNIDSVRQKAVKVLANYEQGHNMTDKTILKVQTMLTVTASVTFLTLILSVFALRRKNSR